MHTVGNLDVFRRQRGLFLQRYFRRLLFYVWYRLGRDVSKYVFGWQIEGRQ